LPWPTHAEALTTITEEKTMTSTTRPSAMLSAVALTFALAAPSVALAAVETTDKPGRITQTVVKSAAIVESVNRETREIKVLDARGERFTIVAGPEVRNFDQIEPRDRIVAEYAESVAVVVLPPGADAEIGEEIDVGAAAEGEKPGAGVIDTMLVTAEVLSINATDRLAVLEFPDGSIRTIKVSPDARLDLVDVGDQVRMRVTRAIAVSVVEPDAP